MSDDKLIISAAGSGKTTFLVTKALEIKDERVLITTYTIANEKEIREKFLLINGCVPENVTIQTWFSVLIEHGVKPFQNFMTTKKVNGLLLTNKKSGFRYQGKFGPVYYSEDEIDKHYFTSGYHIYSDKLSKFVINCNLKSSNAVIIRLEKVYKYLFIDEVQDLAGYDLEIIKLLSKSTITTCLVGDPRQVTYLTHNETKYKKYSEGKIKEFLLNECKKSCPVFDEETLKNSFRCNQIICDFSSKLFKQYETSGSNQTDITGHDGVFFVKEEDVDNYLHKYKPIQLRYSRSKKVNDGFKVYNFGESKGLTFDRVLIYPTKPQLNWILGKDKTDKLKFKARCKLYVALTRAKYSAAIVYNYKHSTDIEFVETYVCSLEKG